MRWSRTRACGDQCPTNQPSAVLADRAVTSSVYSDSFRDRSKSQRENLSAKPSARNCIFVGVTETNRLDIEPDTTYGSVFRPREQFTADGHYGFWTHSRGSSVSKILITIGLQTIVVAVYCQKNRNWWTILEHGIGAASPSTKRLSEHMSC